MSPQGANRNSPTSPGSKMCFSKITPRGPFECSLLLHVGWPCGSQNAPPKLAFPTEKSDWARTGAPPKRGMVRVQRNGPGQGFAAPVCRTITCAGTCPRTYPDFYFWPDSILQLVPNYKTFRGRMGCVGTKGQVVGVLSHFFFGSERGVTRGRRGILDKKCQNQFFFTKSTKIRFLGPDCRIFWPK